MQTRLRNKFLILAHSHYGLPPTARSPNSEVGKHVSQQSEVGRYWGVGWRALYLFLVLAFPLPLYLEGELGEKEEELVRERCQVSKSSSAGIWGARAVPLTAAARMPPGTRSSASTAAVLALLWAIRLARAPGAVQGRV